MKDSLMVKNAMIEKVCSGPPLISSAIDGISYDFRSTLEAVSDNFRLLERRLARNERSEAIAVIRAVQEQLAIINGLGATLAHKQASTAKPIAIASQAVKGV